MDSANRKRSSLSGYRIAVADGAVRPSAPALHRHRRFRTPDYQAGALLTAGGHVVVFRASGVSVSHVVSDDARLLDLTEWRRLDPCTGEREFDERIGSPPVHYEAVVQGEVARSANSVVAEMEEMEAFARQRDAMWIRWMPTGSDQERLSVLDMQMLRRELHAQAWHFDPAGRVIVRVQVVFEPVAGPV